TDMIRALSHEDYPALADLVGAVEVEAPTPTPGGLAHWIETMPRRGRFRGWVAEEHGRVVAAAWGYLEWSVSAEGAASLWTGVRPEARRRGIGSALFAAAEEHLLTSGARKLSAFALEHSDGERFLRARGFRRTRTSLVQRLDPSTADVSALAALEEAKRGEGFALVPLGAVADRPRELHALYAAASEAIPADDPEDDIRFDEFVSHLLGDPELTSEGSYVVLADGRPAALAFLLVNREAAAALNEMTGTLPDFRGRGLARLAKLATVRWARAQGIRELVTENDYENEAMRALNRSLGYRVTHVRAWLSRSADGEAGREASLTAAGAPRLGYARGTSQVERAYAHARPSAAKIADPA
ncbi:MAG: GNAT family N-acetyltransferase, partial [Actinomycetota bacterium]|nr:GNAT family N-acetyltransferase [Actinomycetota bacterium]